jgi:hypothetical protein
MPLAETGAGSEALVLDDALAERAAQAFACRDLVEADPEYAPLSTALDCDPRLLSTAVFNDLCAGSVAPLPTSIGFNKVSSSLGVADAALRFLETRKASRSVAEDECFEALAVEAAARAGSTGNASKKRSSSLAGVSTVGKAKSEPMADIGKTLEAAIAGDEALLLVAPLPLASACMIASMKARDEGCHESFFRPESFLCNKNSA